jgi:hypothetical protein
MGIFYVKLHGRFFLVHVLRELRGVETVGHPLYSITVTDPMEQDTFY